MDKNKIIEAAAKLVAKGAYDKAIKEYQKVLEADPKDVRVLQKMGELYQKKNDNVQAAQYFIKVAESYSSDGFFLKAVALYKQVLKLNPGLIEVNIKLAELHQQLQLMGEAMAYYQLVANHYDKAGDVKLSLDTLKKMVDLDPDNVASRIKLAELYARENMNKEAAVEFKKSAEYLKRNNRTDDYLRVAERLSALQPEDLPLAKELAQGYVQRQDFKRALAKLQVCFKADSRDIETLNLLAQSFQGLGQTSKTVSVYKELAKIYQEKNRNDEANKIWARVEQLDSNDPDVLARKQSVARPAAAPAAAAQRAAPAAAAPAASGGGGGGGGPPQGAPPAPAKAPSPNAQLAKLLTETDVYVKYGLHDKALEHLRKIFGVDPENLDAHEKAYHIYLAANNQAQASEQLLNVLRLCTRRVEVQRAQPYLATLLQQNPGHPEAPAFLAVLRPGAGGGEGTAPEQDVAEDAILVDSNDEEVIVAEAPEDALAGQSVESLNTAPDEEVVSEEPELIASEEIEPATTSDFPADEPLVSQEDDPFAAPAEEAALEPTSGELVVEEPEEDVSPAASQPTAPHRAYANAFAEDDDAPTTVGNLPPELGEEPSTSAGQDAFAEDTDANAQAFAEQEAEPQVVEEEAPADDAFAADAFVEPPPLEDLDSATAAPAQEEAPQEEAVAAPEEADPAAEELDEASFFLDQGLTEEAREIIETVNIAYPGNARAAELLTRLEEMEASGQSASNETPQEEEVQPPQVNPVDESEAAAVAASAEGGEKDAFDLAAELADELGEIGGEEPAPAEEAAQSSDEFQVSVEQVFSEFKKGLEKVVKPEDVETHYDLGIAYKEMGLMDDGINEFKVARQGCIGKKKEVECLAMIAAMQLMKGEQQDAITTLKEAMQSQHAVGEAEKALRYDLGTAYEQASQAGKALFHFLAVQKLDAKYRDVPDIVKRLQASAKPEEDVIARASPNGANGAHAAKPAAGAPAKPGAAPAAGAAPANKSRKVGYV